jgi:hypothetical protein
MREQIRYRGWEIDPYRQPDECFYAYAPDYDGLTPSDTQLAPTLCELCDMIDDEMERRDSDAAAIAAPCGDMAVPKDQQARAEGIARKDIP